MRFRTPWAPFRKLVEAGMTFSFLLFSDTGEVQEEGIDDPDE
jgi:hypothetical protein